MTLLKQRYQHSELLVLVDCLFLDGLQIIAVIIMFAGNFKIIDMRHIFNKFQSLEKATL